MADDYSVGSESRHSDLEEYEDRLREEVDEDFFEDPKSFKALHRVIDVLGAQLLDGQNVIVGTGSSRQDFENLHRNNPAYLALRRQQHVVAEAIEHLAVHHCADLNKSVVAVGRVSRQFSEAVDKVRTLRRQVQDVKDSIGGGGPGAAGGANPNEPDQEAAGGGIDRSSLQTRAAVAAPPPPTATASSLRELWLKKLECEAVLSLLHKLEIVREAPSTFDMLIHPPSGGPCRIGAAVVVLSNALTTMFSDDVSQVQALTKIMEHLTTRKLRAEEIVWDAIHDVIYLRTANGTPTARGTTSGAAAAASGAGGGGVDGSISGTGNERRKRRSKRSSLERGAGANATYDREGDSVNSHDDDEEDDDDDMSGRGSFASDDEWSVASGYSQRSKSQSSKDGSASDNKKKGGAGGGKSSSSSAPTGGRRRSRDSYILSSSYLLQMEKSSKNFESTVGQGPVLMLLPRPLLDTELDLELDEIRCLENAPTVPSASSTVVTVQQQQQQQNLPRYTEPVLALRILVECLVKLGRIDDVERYLNESVERELRKIAEREQANTYARLERRSRRGGAAAMVVAATRARHYGRGVVLMSEGGRLRGDPSLREFRSHLSALLTAYGTVMLRLALLAQILRHRITSDKKLVTPSYTTPSSAMHSVLVTAYTHMQREIKGFLRACLKESDSSPPQRSLGGGQGDNAASSSRGRDVSSHERGLFSLGIIGADASTGANAAIATTGGTIRGASAVGLELAASRASVMELPPDQFVVNVLFPRTNTGPDFRHALAFRRSLARWTSELTDMKAELASLTNEDTSSPTYNATTEQTALDYVDSVIRRSLLPILQDEAVNGTVSALEREDAFEPILDASLFTRTSVAGGRRRGSQQHLQQTEAEMCIACQALAGSTAPLFAALHRLPKGGEMYTPLVAVLEHAVLTFISRVKQRVSIVCGNKAAFSLLEGTSGRMEQTEFGKAIEMRRAFALLLRAYGEGNVTDGTDMARGTAPIGLGDGANVLPLAPSASDTKTRSSSGGERRIGLGGGLNAVSELAQEEDALKAELVHLQPLFDFSDESRVQDLKVCSDEGLMKAACLAHSLLKVSTILERRLSVKGGSWEKTAGATRALRDAIATTKMHGLRVAKFCRVDMMIQTAKRMAKLCRSSALVANDAVRLPSCVNELGEYLVTASDNMREAAGNVIAAYALSSLEQYIPLFLMQNVRVIARGQGLPPNSPITVNGVEALDRSGSVLYRDLKSATTFDNSFWDDDAAADAFERSASFVAMVELDMDELISYYRCNPDDFSDDDYKLMFSMDGPRRKGDSRRYSMLKQRMDS